MINNPSESFYSKAISNANVASMSSEKLGKYYRNEMQNAILRTIKETTDQHMSGLKAAENQSNLLLGAATIGLAGGAAVVGGTAARALAAAATGTAGARSLVNEQVYRNTFVESLIALIQDDQEKFLAKIRLEQIKPIEDYTVEAAIMDAKEYERRGSFYHGLSLLQVAVQSKVNTGANPLVPSNQYGMLPPVLGSTNIVEIRMPLATDSLTPTTIEQLWAGERFSQIISDPTVTPAALANAVKVTINRNDTTDHSLKLKFATTNKTALTVTDGKLVFDYSYQATSGKLSIPITLIIGSK